MSSTHITLDHPSWPEPRGCDVIYEINWGRLPVEGYHEVTDVEVFDEGRDITHLFDQQSLCELIEERITQ